MLGENLKYQLLFIFFELQQNNNIDVFPFFRNFFFFWYFSLFLKVQGIFYFRSPKFTN